jgi:hypothetical protein
MWSMTGYNGGPWVGLSRETGEWRWQSGEPVTESPWLPGEPNGSGEFACFYGGGDGPLPGLDDTFAGNARRTLLIEFPSAACIGDLDQDRIVSGADLGLLLGQWGPCAPKGCIADLDGDQVVSGSDLGLLLGQWGACP